MTPQERCKSAEECLNSARQLLLSPTPAALDECVEILGEAAEMLAALAHGPSSEWDASVLSSIRRVQTEAHGLSAQIEHGSKLISGWMQLLRGSGYTRQGLPEFADPGAQRLLEA